MKSRGEQLSPEPKDTRGLGARALHLYDAWVTFIGGDELPSHDAPGLIELEIPGLPEGQEASRADVLNALRKRAKKNGIAFVDSGEGILAPCGAVSDETQRFLDRSLTGGRRLDEPGYWEDLWEGARQLEEEQSQ